MDISRSDVLPSDVSNQQKIGRGVVRFERWLGFRTKIAKKSKKWRAIQIKHAAISQQAYRRRKEKTLLLGAPSFLFFAFLSVARDTCTGANTYDRRVRYSRRVDISEGVERPFSWFLSYTKKKKADQTRPSSITFSQYRVSSNGFSPVGGSIKSAHIYI